MKTQYKAAAVVVFVLAGIFVYIIVLDRLTTDEARIRTAINTIVDSVEAHNLRKISGFLHADFQTEAYNLDRPTALAILARGFAAYRVIRANVRDVTVKIVDDTTAEARFIATVRAARRANSTGEDLLRYRGSDRFLVTFKKEDGDWLIIKSEIIRSTAD
jgi:hypothetical protein